MITLENKRLAKEATKVGIITASWGRSRTVRAVLKYYTDLHAPGVEFIRVIAVSPDDEDPIGEVEGWRQVMVDNSPLGKKFNAAAHEAFNLGVTGVIIIGSDDLLSLKYIDLLIDRIKRRYDFVMPTEMAVYKPGDERVRVCLSATPGAGRYVSRVLYLRMNACLWDDSADSYLDQSMMVRMRGLENVSHTVRDMLGQGYIVLDIKTEGNMWDLTTSDRKGQMALVNNETKEMLYIRGTIAFPVDRFMAQYFPHFDYKSL